MTKDGPRRTPAPKKPAGTGRAAAAGKRPAGSEPLKASAVVLPPEHPPPEQMDETVLAAFPEEKRSLVRMLVGMTSAAVRIASRTGGVSARVGKALTLSPDRRRMLTEAGESIRDLRQVAGLTVKELSEAARIPDQSFIKAVENGTATLSFELILRLSALLARHDPLPFIIKYTRTYSPEVWAALENWGLGRLPLQLERERRFINIYRRHDAARRLSDEGFDRALTLTAAAFEMALAYAVEAEGIESMDTDSPRRKTAEKDADYIPGDRE